MPWRNSLGKAISLTLWCNKEPLTNMPCRERCPWILNWFVPVTPLLVYSNISENWKGRRRTISVLKAAGRPKDFFDISFKNLLFKGHCRCMKNAISQSVWPTTLQTFHLLIREEITFLNSVKTLPLRNQIDRRVVPQPHPLKILLRVSFQSQVLIFNTSTWKHTSPTASSWRLWVYKCQKQHPPGRTSAAVNPSWWACTSNPPG